jgi:hypothetical protein
MAKHPVPGSGGEGTNGPRVVRITVVADPDARTLRERITAPRRRLATCRVGRGWTIALCALVLGAAVTGAVGASGGERRAGSGEPSAGAREAGPAGVAAAYGYPLRCLVVTILATEPAYARADFDHRSPCGRYTGDPTAIFHRARGAWRAVLETSAYFCPVASLPSAVSFALAVCAQTAIRRRAG